MKYYIGVDPGLKGGLALIGKELALYHPMPENMSSILSFFEASLARAGHRIDLVAVVEKVHAMPKQGVSSMFTFGKGYGAILMAATAMCGRHIEVTPQEWKREMLKGTDKGKDASIQVCESLFHDVQLVPKGCRKPHDGMAEAILLAEYGRRKNL